MLRLEDLSHKISTVGGDTFLRGFPSGYFKSSSYWGANLEFRTRPWRFTPYLLVGFATFVDFGDAFSDRQDLGLNGSTGGGLRVMIPQINRAVFRADVGFPVGAPGLGSSTTLQFEQVF